MKIIVNILRAIPDVGSGRSPVISMWSSRKRVNVTLVGKPATPLYGIRCSAVIKKKYFCLDLVVELKDGT